MDATCKVQDNIHVFRLVHNMCPGFWVHIIISGLFNGEWKGIINYDKEVNNTLKSFSLFDKVDTGVEVESNKEINNLFIQKYKKIALCIILTCIMSTVVIKWNRKKYENNHNLRTREY